MTLLEKLEVWKGLEMLEELEENGQFPDISQLKTMHHIRPLCYILCYDLFWLMAAIGRQLASHLHCHALELQVTITTRLHSTRPSQLLLSSLLTSKKLPTASSQPPSLHSRQLHFSSYVHTYVHISTLSHPYSSTPTEFKICQSFPSRVLVARRLWSSLHTAIHMYELHVFCAACGHAPNILGFKSLSGGFFGIAMELIEPSWQILSSPFLAKHGEWANQLNQLVLFFHAKGLVHRNFQNPKTKIG